MSEKKSDTPKKELPETGRRYIVIPQDTVEMPGIPGMVYVPAGEFIMGTNDGFRYEAPARSIFIQGYYIDKSEVTNMQYQRFVDSTGHNPPAHWKGGRYPKGEENFPVTNVSYYDALSYTRWAGKRLPTEEEWEKVARGTDGRIYPWGNQWKKKAANVKPLVGFGGMNAVGSFPEGKSPYGCMDMAGNVWEWTTSWFSAYPGNVYFDINYGEKYKVIRGGSYRQSEIIAQCPRRDFLDPELSRIDVGFRCAK
ncbi:MAG: SUMF1/EgtB/PvdO family nonheme iron enzyme [Elusimicrobiota bacterium]